MFYVSVKARIKGRNEGRLVYTEHPEAIQKEAGELRLVLPLLFADRLEQRSEVTVTVRNAVFTVLFHPLDT